MVFLESVLVLSDLFLDHFFLITVERLDISQEVDEDARCLLNTHLFESSLSLLLSAYSRLDHVVE